jgi:SAM-dependent methyltransferase
VVRQSDLAVTRPFDIRQLFLGIPLIYNLFQRVVGRDKVIPRLAQLLAIKSGERVLDIGCGTAEILQSLPVGVDYHGYDVSEDYVSAARARFGDRASFSVHAVSLDAAVQPEQFDVVIALGVLHHLTDAEAGALFATARRALRPGGRILTIDGTYVLGQNPIARLLLKLDRGRHVRSPEQYIAIARRSFPKARARVLNDLLYIPYTHCLVEAVSGDQ